MKKKLFSFMKKRDKEIFIILLIIFSLIRLNIMSNTPMYLQGNAMHDDKLLADYAQNILNGSWLGYYNNLTLVKGISFPIFVVICSKLLISYQVGVAIFFIFSALLFLKAISPKVKNKYILLIIYLFLLFSPVGFTLNWSQRFYRMILIPPTIILVISSMLGLYNNIEKTKKTCISWSLILGVSIIFFWYLREDSIWFLPFIILSLTLLSIYTFFKLEKIKTLIIFLPILLLVCSNLFISAINKNYYGVFTVNDRSNTNFAKISSNLLKIDNTSKRKEVWVSKDTINKVLKISPTLSTIKEQILSIYDKNSKLSSWLSNGELPGDIFTWAIRDAVQESGYYSSAIKADKFYKNVNKDLEKVFKTGKLKKKKAIFFSSQSKGIEKKELPKLLANTISNLKYNIKYEKTGVKVSSKYASTGNYYEIRSMEALSKATGIKASTYNLKLYGYIYSKNKENEISAKVVDKDNNIITNLNLFNSDELNEKYDDNSSKNSAFYVDIQNLTYNGKLYIQLFLNNKLYDKIDIESVESNNYKVKIDNYLYTEIEDPVIYKSKDLVTLSNAFVKIYKKTGVLIFIISMISYIIITIITIKTIIQKKFKNLKMWIIDSGILGSILVLGLGVTLFTDWLGHDAYCFYSIGINTLIQLFEIVSIIGLLYIKKDWRKSKNEKE